MVGSVLAVSCSNCGPLSMPSAQDEAELGERADGAYMKRSLSPEVARISIIIHGGF